ncbi:MAG TPA: radical SAM family heme chaperone HemW [Actinomycetota bacterium]|nr:radical SAM family heme chaperone HemW [Actinomycetota bacterium]
MNSTHRATVLGNFGAGEGSPKPGSQETSTATRTGRDGRWLADPGLGVYVHIPFCRHRCHYCDFNTYAKSEHLFAAYVEALIAEIERSPGSSRPATSVFFGGGTPTLLTPLQLSRILGAVRSRIGIEPDAEITIEGNPEGLDEKFFEQLLHAGFNRFSIGVQSLAPHVLAALERTHSAETALRAALAARKAGVTDLNLDLIYGSPWETERDWRDSVVGVIEAGPDHVSAYALTVESRTPLGAAVAQGRVPDVDPDIQADRHHAAEDLLGRSGYRRYEVSNWARPGHASRHNLLYWSAGNYWGFGAGAHGHEDGWRYWRIRRPADFIATVRAGGDTVLDSEIVAGDARAAEALMLGLRLTDGINLIDWSARFGGRALDRRMSVITELTDLGLLSLEQEYLRVRPQHTLMLGEVIARLL